jgi:hypothetical protein
MTCVQAQPILDDLARKAILDKDLEREALAHVESCAGCASYLQAREALTRALGALAEADLDREAPPRVEATLRAAFWNGREPARVAPATPVLIGLGAAAVLVVAALMSPPRTPSAGLPAASGAVPPEEARGPAADGAFVTLPNADPLTEGESGEVMRVSLPISALADLGLSTADENTVQTVEADVLLGEDGLPRALRLAE